MIRILLRTRNTNCVTGTGGGVYSFYHLFITTVKNGIPTLCGIFSVIVQHGELYIRDHGGFVSSSQKCHPKIS